MSSDKGEVMPGAFATGNDQSAANQLKLLQLHLCENIHLLDGLRAIEPIIVSMLSQLTVHVDFNCTPLPPPPEIQAMTKSLFDKFIGKGGPSVLSNKYLLVQEEAEDWDEETSSTKQSNPTCDTAVPFKSLPIPSIAALNIFLSIPSYANIILRHRRAAMMLIRLARSVSDEKAVSYLDWADVELLAFLPFELFQQLLDAHSLDSPEGTELRQKAVDNGSFQLLLAFLAVCTHQVKGGTVSMKPFGFQFVVGRPSAPSCDGTAVNPATSKQKGWIKGTGYESGEIPGAQSSDVEGAKQRQRFLEKMAVCLLRTLASFVNPSTPPASLSNPILLPVELEKLIQSSYLGSAIHSYLNNDSWMYVTEHGPMFQAIFNLLRSFAARPKVSSTLFPPLGGGSSTSSESHIFWLLRKLRNMIPRNISMSANVEDPEGEAELTEDLILTWTVVKTLFLPDHHPSQELAHLAPPAVSCAAISASCDSDGFKEMTNEMPMDYQEPQNYDFYESSYDEDEDDEDDVYEEEQEK